MNSVEYFKNEDDLYAIILRNDYHKLWRKINYFLDDFPPAHDAGGKKFKMFQNSKISKIYYCYNNNNSQPLGQPIFSTNTNNTD